MLILMEGKLYTHTWWFVCWLVNLVKDMYKKLTLIP